MPFTIKEILPAFTDCDFIGDQNCVVEKPLRIQDVLTDKMQYAVTWVKDANASNLKGEKLSVSLLVLSQTSYELLKHNPCNFLITKSPKATFIKILALKFSTFPKSQIHITAVIHPTAKIGSNCFIGHHVVIEEDCIVGDGCVIFHNTVIMARTVIGKHVIMGCNNTIGNYGFGYDKDEHGNYQLLQHFGNVVIKDDVEIHNNTCIDCGTLGSTIIHDNCKIDNHVHIAHNVEIGRNSLVIANSMIGGSVKIGENCWVAPSVSVKNQVIIGNNSTLGMGTVVLKNVYDNETVFGNPSATIEDYRKWSAIRKKLLNEQG